MRSASGIDPVAAASRLAADENNVGLAFTSVVYEEPLLDRVRATRVAERFFGSPSSGATRDEDLRARHDRPACAYERAKA